VIGHSLEETIDFQNMTYSFGRGYECLPLASFGFGETHFSSSIDVSDMLLDGNASPVF